MTERGSGPSGNAFEPNKPGTPARALAEARIEGLRAQGGVFAEAVRATRMPMVVTDPSLPGNPIVFANEAFLALSGYAMAEVLGQGPHFMNGPETDPADAVRLRAALEQDRDEVVETIQYRKDGSRFVASVFTSAFKDEHGSTAHQFLSYLDVTRRVAAEERLMSRERMEAGLRESEVRHRLLIESWAQAVWETDANGVVVADSPSWRAFTGQTLEEWLGHGWLDAIHPGDRAHAGRQWREAVAARGPVNAEFRLRAPGGGWRWTNLRAAPVLDAAGRIERWVGMNIDIDARRRAEAALRESEERYRTLFEAMDEAYAVVEVLRDEGGAWHDFRFLEVNPAFVAHTSLPDPVGRTATELLGSPNPRWTQLYGQVLDTGEALRLQEAEPTLGRVFDLNIFALDRERNRVAVLFTDVTARLRAEEALRESEARSAFLVRFSDAVRGLSDPRAVAEQACRLVAERLGTERAYWAEIDWDRREYVVGAAFHLPGVSVVEGRFPLDAWEPFTSFHLDGRPVVVDDTQTDARVPPAMKEAYARLAVGADLAVPVLVHGRLRCTLAVNGRAPRHWTPEEVALLGGVAGRCWAEVERARAEAALRQSEERLRLALEVAEMGSFLWHPEEDRAEADERTLKLFGFPRDRAMSFREVLSTRVHPGDRDRHAAAVARALDPAGEGILREEVRVLGPDGTERWLSVAGQTRFGSGRRRATAMAGTVRDVTAGKFAEAVLREREARQAFLLKLSDTLRGEAEEEQIERVALELLAERLSADRAYITTSDYERGETVVPAEVRRAELPPLVGIFRHSDFPESARAVNEGALVIADVGQDAGLSELNRKSFEAVAIGALIGVGLRRGTGDIFWTLAVAMVEPRNWTSGDVHLVEEVAERTLAALSRARAEAALRRSEERQAFLLKLSDALRPVADPVEIQRTATRLLGEQLGASRVFYVLVEEDEDTATILANYTDGVPERLGRYSLSAFSSYAAGEWRAGRTASTDDVEADPRWGEAERAAYASVSTRAGFGIPLIKGGRLVALLGVNQSVPRRWTDAERELAREVAERTWDAVERARAEAQLRESEERFRTLAEGIPPLVWRSCDEGRWTWASPQWRDYTGQSQAESRDLGWLEAVHPEDRARTMAAWHDAHSRGGLDVECRVRRASDGAWRWHQTRAVPVRGGPTAERPEDRVAEWLGTTMDIEELKRLGAQQAVLVAELLHRTRNLLAVVGNVARRSIAPQPGRDEYDKRLSALGRVQGFLARSSAYVVPLRELVEAELQAAGDGVSDRVTVDGPPVALPGEGVQAVALALHELATNAVKYGAIAQPAGRLSVSWRVEDGEGGPRLHIAWKESGVSMPDGPPARRGYGSELITRALPYQMQAETALEFTPDGVRCRITLPADAFRAGEAGA
jgi:PAS domain S-box-containing protein